MTLCCLAWTEYSGDGLGGGGIECRWLFGGVGPFEAMFGSVSETAVPTLVGLCSGVIDEDRLSGTDVESDGFALMELCRLEEIDVPIGRVPQEGLVDCFRLLGGGDVVSGLRARTIRSAKPGCPGEMVDA